MMSAPAASACIDLLEALRFDLDRHLRLRRLHPLHGLATPPARRTWLSLISTPSSSPARWLVPRAGADRVLLQRAQRRRRLARVEHRDPAAAGVDESARERGDSRESLQEIERGALGGQHRRRQPAQLGDDVAGLAAFAVRDA